MGNATPSATPRALPVLYADNHLLVVRKEAGEPVVPDRTGDGSLLERARAWVAAEYGKPRNVYLGVVHRLDRPVSGVVLFARTSKAAARLSAQFREGRVAKRYLAVCPAAPFAGAHAPRGGTVEQWLRKNRTRNTVSVVSPGTAGAQHARTRWRLVALAAAPGGAAAGAAAGGRALLALRPESGRPHQLRVACASLGAPILGDLRYGAPAPLPDRSVALHAAALGVTHPTRGERMRWTAPPPATPWWRWTAATERRDPPGAGGPRAG